MVMNQTSSEEEIGWYGERIVDMELKRRGFKLYHCDEKFHQFDRIAVGGWNEKDLQIFGYDVKTKPRLFSCIETGCNTDSYKRYLYIKNTLGIKFYLFFVDWFEECIYGDELEQLGQGDEGHKLTCWPLERMDRLKGLMPFGIEWLKEKWLKGNSKYKNAYDDKTPFFIDNSI